MNDLYELFKNGQKIYNGNAFPTPDVNQEVAALPGAASSGPEVHGYDALAFAYRGEGTHAWEQSGSPPYDVKGRELDIAGWPTGKMKDDSVIDGGTPTPAPSLVGGEVPVTIAKVDSPPVVISFDIPTAGPYYLLVGEGVQQGEQAWVIAQHGEVKATGTIGVEPGNAFPLEAGPGTLSAQYQPGSVRDDVIADRLANGHAVSTGHYSLRAA